MRDGTGPENLHLREYLRVVRKHVGLVIACLVVTVAMVAVGTFLQQPVYRAVTRVFIERESPRVVNIQEVVGGETDSVELFQTQVEIIRSRPVVQRVLDSLGLTRRKPELADAVDPVARFLRSVAVEPVRNTRLVEIKVDDPDPNLAAEIANAMASGYVRQNLELKFNAAREALTWLTAQADDLKAKVNDSELALQQYKEQSGIVALEEKQSLAAKKLAEFNSAYIEAKARRLEMETRLAELRKAARQPSVLEASPIVINNLLIQRLKGQLVELEVQRSKLIKTYKDKHPEVIKLQSQIEEIRESIAAEVRRLVQSLESEYRALQAREAAMLNAVSEYRDEAQTMAKKEIRYGMLKREADSTQQLYDVLLKRLKETSLSQGLDTNNVRIVEAAVVPGVPFRPRKVLNIAIAVVVGLTLGLALAFFVEYMDDTVRTPEQIEQTLAVPVFALIPVIPGRNPAK